VIAGDVELRAEAARLHDYRTVEFTYDIEAGREFAWQYEYTRHMGQNATQNRIRLR
jgi:hypothetical protein